MNISYYQKFVSNVLHNGNGEPMWCFCIPCDSNGEIYIKSLEPGVAASFRFILDNKDKFPFPELIEVITN